MNKKMVELLSGLSLEQFVLGTRICFGSVEIIKFGFREVEGSVLLKYIARDQKIVGAEGQKKASMDQTGYESLFNKIHIDLSAKTYAGESYIDLASQKVPNIVLKQAIIFALEINQQLVREYPTRKFSTSLNYNDDHDCTVRFHTIRTGERLYGEDMDSFPSAFLEIETP